MSESGYPGLLRNAVVAASAGTGKTRFLTGLFVARALGLGAEGKPVAPEHIVATTFSRAAALELRERIEKTLGELAAQDRDPAAALDAPLRQRARELGLDAAALRGRARRACNELGAATIDTLHGVAIWILRRHAIELGLVPSFAVLDEQQALGDLTEVIEQELAAALEAGGRGERGARALIDACRGLENTTLALRYLLERLDDEGLAATELAGAGEVQAAAELRTELLAICDRIAADGSAAVLDPARVCARALRSSEQSLTSLGEALAGLFEVRLTRALKRLPGCQMLDAFLERLKGSKALKARALAGLLFLAPELEENAQTCANLVGAIQRRLREARTRRGAYGFGDLLCIARDALRDQPAIAALAAAQIDTLLVDEFQDTSRVQRDLILLLRERPDAALKREPGRLPRAQDLSPSGLVVVGDRKQSIYGFRGADVSVFAELAAELAGESAVSALELGGVRGTATPVADFKSLKHNYRSGPAILEAVNLIARRDFAVRPERPYEVRYADAEALSPPAQAAGERGLVTLIGDDGSLPEAAPAIVAGATAGLRSAFVAASFCLHSAASGAAFRDIAVLARRRATLPLVELALDRVRVPYVVSGRALYATREVRELFAALRLAHDPLDRHALAVVARGLLGGLSDPTLCALCEPRRGLLPAARWHLDAIDEPEQRQAARLLQERLLDFAHVAPRLSPRDALSFAIDLFELEAVLSALPRGQVRLGNALRLIEIAARQGGGLASFVRWLDEQIATEADESEAAVFSEEDDAVRLLTIHGSKGLAFPIVVLLDIAASEQARNFPLSLFRDGQRTKLMFRQRSPSGALHHPGQRAAYEDQQRRANAERQRLSYVALTRAVHELALVLPPDAATLKAETLATTLAALRQSGELLAIPGTRELCARELLALGPCPPERAGAAPEPPPRRPAEASVSALTLAATALGDFALCPRRFELVHVLGLDEPALSGGPALEAAGDDPRTLGSAAHRLLERWPLERWGEVTSEELVLRELEREGLEPTPAAHELAQGLARFLAGAFAGRVQRARRVERELELSTLFELAPPPDAGRARRGAPNPLQLDLFAAPSPASRAGTRVLLKTTLDLLVEHADGSIDIVDYKRSKGRFGERYSLQLSAYKAAVTRHYSATAVRTGLVHLLGQDPEPVWSEPAPLDVTALTKELCRARWDERFLPVEKPRCEAIGCGFVTTCHRAKTAP